MSTLTNLPADVRWHITSFISEKSDLRRLYRSCKDMYAATIPRLYRNITIHEDIDRAVLAAALSPDNGGLQHVRHLEIVANCGDYHHRKSRIDDVVTMLANLLPKDKLLTFM